MLQAALYSYMIVFISSFTETILSTRYAFAPANTKPSLRLPLFAFASAMEIAIRAVL